VDRARFSNARKWFKTLYCLKTTAGNETWDQVWGERAQRDMSSQIQRLHSRSLCYITQNSIHRWRGGGDDELPICLSSVADVLTMVSHNCHSDEINGEVRQLGDSWVEQREYIDRSSVYSSERRWWSVTPRRHNHRQIVELIIRLVV